MGVTYSRDGSRWRKHRPHRQGLHVVATADMICLTYPWKGGFFLMAQHRWTRQVFAAKWFESSLYKQLAQEHERGIEMSFLDQVKKARGLVGTDAAFLDVAFKASHPALTEFLTVTKHGDGTPRQTATLLMFVESGTFKVCLGDRDSGLSLWAAGETLQEALEALEACLQSPNPQWRQGSKRTPRKP